MNYRIKIFGAVDTVLNFNLADGPNLLGSSTDCQIQVEHSELEPNALQIDVRKDDIWVQNLNPYSIYLGDREVVSHGWECWSPNETIQLTQSLSIELESVQPISGIEEKTTTESKSNSKMIQIILICVCFVAAPLIFILSPSQSTDVVEDKNFQFEETVQLIQNEIEKNPSNPELTLLRDCLQRAWMAEKRWGKSDRRQVLQRYQQLADHRYFRVYAIAMEKNSSTSEIPIDFTKFGQLYEWTGNKLSEYKK